MTDRQTRNGVLAALARHSVIYGIGSALAAAGGFLLIPLYTHVLSTSQYGVLELLNRVADIMLLVMFMGLRQAYIRFFFEDPSPSWQRTVTASTIGFVLVSSLVLGGLFYAVHEPALGLFMDPSQASRLVLLVLAWIPAEMLLQVGMAYLQVRVRSLLYVTISVLRLFCFVLLNLYLIWFHDYGVAGVLTAQVIVTGALAGGFLLYFIRQTRMRMSLALIRRLIAFGLPYLPATALMYVVNNGDRYFIGAYGSLAAVGVYALAHKIGMMGTQFLMDPFNKVWSPFLFENYHRPEGPQLVGRVFTLYSMVNVFVALGISVAAPVVIPWISQADFHGAALLVPLIALASVFYGMACLGDAGILIAKKTRYKPLVFGVAAAVSVAGNLLLVPPLGAHGAAIAICGAFLALLLTTFAVSNRFYRMQLPVGQIVMMFLAAVGLYLAALYGMTALSGWGWDIAVGAVAVLAFPALIWWGGFLDPQEKAMVRRLLGRLRLGRRGLRLGQHAESREA